MTKSGFCLIFLALIFLGIFLTSCLPSTGHISWQGDEDVEADLGKGHLHPGFTYYYSGSEALPHTIIALKNDVPFQQNFWKSTQFGEMQVKEWLYAFDNPHRQVTDKYFGGKLLDRKGNFIGVWYSKYYFYSGYLDSEGKLIILRPSRRGKEGWSNFLRE